MCEHLPQSHAKHPRVSSVREGSGLEALGGAPAGQKTTFFQRRAHRRGTTDLQKKPKLNVIIYLGELKSKKSGTSQFTHHAKGTFRCSCMT